MQQQVLAWPRSFKRGVVVALDVALALLATWLAYSLRFETLHSPSGAQWWPYLLTPALGVTLLAAFGQYQTIFRYGGSSVLRPAAWGAALLAVVLTTLLVLVRWPMVPRSLGILQPLIFFILMGASRVGASAWFAEALRAPQRRRVLIYGAGAAGVQTAIALGAGALEVVGFIDDDPAKTGRRLQGLRVHAPDYAIDHIDAWGVTDILLALPSVARSQRNHILTRLQPLPVHVRTLPGVEQIAAGQVRVDDIRDLDIEDLLGRDPVPPDPQLLAHDLRDRVVLVTGAGGSIGAELCRQIVEQGPRQLLLYEHSEFALYSVLQSLQERCASLPAAPDLVPLLGSVTHAVRLDAVMTQYRPHTLYHAAAYKHVPLVEDNPAEGVRNNVLGTWLAARAALSHGVQRFVLISTDKAVRPTNVMGASKRMAELILQALAAHTQGTLFSMVRFGNVLGSSGSVVPLFRQQIAQGGPLTVTHPEVTRYFMTIPEAAQLVLQAGAMGQGGDVFVLDMGEPVRIIDLARRMIELSGLRVREPACPEGDLAIEVCGLRPGEKLYEELLIGDNPQATAHPRIWRAQEAMLAWDALKPQLERLSAAADANDSAALRAVLAACVQGFSAQANTPPADTAQPADSTLAAVTEHDVTPAPASASLAL